MAKCWLQHHDVLRGGKLPGAFHTLEEPADLERGFLLVGSVAVGGVKLRTNSVD